MNSRRSVVPETMLVLWLVIGLATPAVSEEPSRHFRRGAQSLGFATGVGVGTGIRPRTAGQDVRDVLYVPFDPMWSIGLSDPLGGDSWYRGNFELGVEAILLLNTDPTIGFAGGAALDIRYNFLASERLVPFVEAGGGVIGLDWDLTSQGNGFNFVLHAGVGLYWIASEHWALMAAWRYQHISNAQIYFPNEGIDASVPMLGVRYFLD